MVLAKTTKERIHLGQEYYNKTEECGLFSSAASAVASTSVISPASAVVAASATSATVATMVITSLFMFPPSLAPRGAATRGEGRAREDGHPVVAFHAVDQPMAIAHCLERLPRKQLVDDLGLLQTKQIRRI